MRYHASWRNTKGWWVVCLFLSMPLLVAGATDRALWPMVLGMGPIVYLYAIGRRLSVEVDERGIRYQGWLTSTEANWKDVTGVTNAENFRTHENGSMGRTATKCGRQLAGSSSISCISHRNSGGHSLRKYSDVVCVGDAGKRSSPDQRFLIPDSGSEIRG